MRRGIGRYQGILSQQEIKHVFLACIGPLQGGQQLPQRPEVAAVAGVRAQGEAQRRQLAHHVADGLGQGRQGVVDVAGNAHAVHGGRRVAAGQIGVGFGHAHQLNAAVHGAAQAVFIQRILAFQQAEVEAQGREVGAHAGVLHVGRGHAFGPAGQQQRAGVVVVVVGKHHGPRPVVAQGPAVHLVVANGVKDEIKKTPRPAAFGAQQAQ